MPDNNEHDKAGDTAQGGNTPKYVTTEEVSEIVNKAISSRYKQVDSKLDKVVTDVTSTLDKRLEEILSKVGTKPEPEEDKSDKGDKSKKDKTEAKDVKEDPMVKDLAKRLADAEKALETTKREKQVETERRRDRELRQKLSDELVKNGIDPARVKHAVGILVDSDKLVQYSDTDSDDLVFLDSDGDALDLKAGLKSWMKTDDAKIYMPARGTTGSGSRPTERKASTGKEPGQDIGNMLARALLGGSSE